MNKKLVGGDYLLDLTPITIEKSDDGNYTNITNKDVLAQLTNLKKYVKNPMMVKPVWVRFKNGETNELVVARGTFAVVDAGEFEICIISDGYKLKLHIEFTQAELEDHTPIDDWYIDTNDAKFIFTSDYKRVVVEDVKNIDGNILSTLQCGDVVIKHDESGEHSYIVTFKSDTGICLTYADASCVETQSYDLIDGEWVYNSEDKWEMTKPVYCHPITLQGDSGDFAGTKIIMLIFNNKSIAYTKTTIKDDIASFTGRVLINGYVCVGGSNYFTSFLSPTNNILAIKSDGTSGAFAFNDVVDATGMRLEDDVNKIN